MADKAARQVHKAGSSTNLRISTGMASEEGYGDQRRGPQEAQPQENDGRSPGESHHLNSGDPFAPHRSPCAAVCIVMLGRVVSITLP